jgi:hypothetical protein
MIDLPYLRHQFEVSLLVDTGASKTQLNWYDAFTTELYNKLDPQNSILHDGEYTGLGGNVSGYKIPRANIIFNSNIGKYPMPLDYLRISSSQTTDGKKLTPMPSLLGIDILQYFDILFEYKYAYLRKK